MTSSTPEKSIPVVDVDQAFPTMTGVVSQRPAAAAGMLDSAGPVQAALRDILGWRPRVEDPKAFTDALRSSFRLRLVEGHIESEYVPRGYAIQSDLGAVTGGQASFYRRAQVARTEILRILDALVPLRTDSDSQDVEAYRGIIRGAVQSAVDELGAAGGARVEMINAYFRGLTGTDQPNLLGTADGVAGQLGALRERLGLIDDNVNTVEEEGVRTSYWTLVDMVVDLQSSWIAQRDRFAGVGGFLGTDLIRLSRLMEAAADQVDELESVLDSVLVPATERRTIVLNEDTGLTLDGLLTWMSAFLTTEGRRIAQDGGRDGIVSALTPTAIALLKTFEGELAKRIDDAHSMEGATAADGCCPVHYLPASCCSKLPTGMYAARTRIAVASLCRLLTDLAKTAQRIGRWSRVVLLNITIKPVLNRANVAEVEFRGLGMRRSYIPAFVPEGVELLEEGCTLPADGTNELVRAIRGSTTADDESISALFHISELNRVLPGSANRLLGDNSGISLPAEDVPSAVIDGETGTVVYAPVPKTWPTLRRADLRPGAATVLGTTASPASNPPVDQRRQSWLFLPDDEELSRDPELEADPDLNDQRSRVLGAIQLAEQAARDEADLELLKKRRNDAAQILLDWPALEVQLKDDVKNAKVPVDKLKGDIKNLKELQDAAATDVEKRTIQRQIDGAEANLIVETARLTVAEAKLKEQTARKKQADSDVTIVQGKQRINRLISTTENRITKLGTDVISRLTDNSTSQR